jgi:hypothetical protein
MSQPRPFTEGRIVVSQHALERYCERVEDSSHHQVEALVRKAELLNTKGLGLAPHRWRRLEVGEMLVIANDVCFVVCRDGDSNVVVTCWLMDDPPDARVRLPKAVFVDEDSGFEKMSSPVRRLKRKNPRLYKNRE